MNIELWDREESGVLLRPSLLLSACRADALGARVEYPGGSVECAVFTYLSGAPDLAFFAGHPELFLGQYLVCLSREWELFLRELGCVDIVMARRVMRPRRGPSTKVLAPLPAGYALRAFDADIFAAHAFGHGANYGGFEEFAARGAGAVVCHGDEIVASASSFMTYGQAVELDVSTAPPHRRKGLADHCVAAMMADCAARGLTVHWDAQNLPSANMALSHGFEAEQDYAVYVLRQ